MKIPKIILSGEPVPGDYNREVKKFTKQVCKKVKKGFDISFVPAK